MNRMGNEAWKVATAAALSIAALGVACGSANAVNTLNASWTFESPNFGPYPTGSGIVSATGPSALADGGTQAGTATVKAVHASSATTTTTPAGNGSAQSYSTNNWGVGDSYQIQLSTTGLSTIGLQFEQTGSGTGPRDFKVQYSSDGTNFTDLAGGSYTLTGATWAAGGAVTPPQLDTYSYSFGSLLDNLANVYIRLTQADSSSINNGTVAAGGTGRIDNVGIYSSFDISQPPIVPPAVPPVLPIANDVVIGVSNASAKATIGMARGTATSNGGVATSTFSTWQTTPFIQYVTFDNLAGTAHNVHGNLLGVDSGTSAATGGTIYSLPTQGSLPLTASQSLATVSGDRLGQVAVSPNNSRIAVGGADTGQITFFTYTAGNGLGTGAAVSGKQTTAGTPLTPAISTTVGTTTTITQQRQGVAWVDNDNVLSLSTSGNLYLTNANTLASNLKGTVTTSPLISASTSLEYNSAISPYIWAMYGGFNGTQNANLGNSINILYILDPTNYSVLHQVDLSSTSTTSGVSSPAGSVPTANSLAFNSTGDLFIGGNGGSVSVIPHAAANALTLGNLSALPWYVGTFGSFTGIDIGLAGTAPVGVSGDYNNNGVVDMADYVLWRNGGPLQNDPTPGTVDASDYTYWRSRFGATSGSGAGLGNSSAVPEPASALLMLLGFAAFACKRRS